MFENVACKQIVTNLSLMKSMEKIEFWKSKMTNAIEHKKNSY
jgi:hypothetical protein